MRRARTLLFGLIVAMGVLLSVGESQAQVCFSWIRTTFPSPNVGGPVTFIPQGVLQTYVLVFDPAQVVGNANTGTFVKFVGRHNAACMIGTNVTGFTPSTAPMEGMAWFRANTIEFGFTTYGSRTSGNELQPLAPPSPTQCGNIIARAVVDLTTLAGTIKYQEVSATSGTTFGAVTTPVVYELDTVGSVNVDRGLPFGLSLTGCPAP